MKALSQTRKYVSSAILGIMILSIFSFFVPLYFNRAYADEAAAAKEAEVKGTDVYYKTEGIVSSAPAPKMTVKDYPVLKFMPEIAQESRLIVWSVAQQHLFFGSFVLA